MKVIFFDIDGTLLSSGGAGKAAFEAALLTEFALSGIRGRVAYSGRTDRAIARDLFQVHGVADTREHWDRLSARYVANLPASLSSHRGVVLPGIRELLGQLRRRTDVALGLLTGNIRAGAKAKLGHFGLDEYFGFGGFGDHHYCRNEVAREALAVVEEKFAKAVNPEEIWVIGDTPLDVECARTIGAKVVAVGTGIHSSCELAKAQPDILVGDLAEWEAVLGRIL